ncbi:MAG: hypothetical protein V1711_01990 [bacterium]
MSERKLSIKRNSLSIHGERPINEGRLAVRRQKNRRRGLIAFWILLCILFGILIWCIQQNAVRISEIKIFGADESLSVYAIQAMQGNYLGLIPRDSIFFFPEMSIRANLLSSHPEIAAVSIFRNGFSSISIKVDNRVPVARWCGDTARLNLAVQEDCYLFDAKGFIFATTSPITPLNSFIIYGQLANEENEIIGSTLPNANEFPLAFNFARQLRTLGSPVSVIVFRADEVDDYLASGTRITYVLGDEQDTFTALVSARENLNLADGSIDYIDVRFDGKIYIKKKK